MGAGFEVLNAVVMSSSVSWDMTSRNLKYPTD
jgi:hypothetical protein